jgi:hypothetical protein
VAPACDVCIWKKGVHVFCVCLYSFAEKRKQLNQLAVSSRLNQILDFVALTRAGVGLSGAAERALSAWATAVNQAQDSNDANLAQKLAQAVAAVCCRVLSIFAVMSSAH